MRSTLNNNVTILCVELQKSIDEFEVGNIEPVHFAKFLKKWLMNHIAVYDKKYAPYLEK